MFLLMRGRPSEAVRQRRLPWSMPEPQYGRGGYALERRSLFGFDPLSAKNKMYR